MNKLQWKMFSRYRRLKSKPNQGFTLIELLIGLIMATLIITPVLGFMVNILETDRKEQAKSNTEQEIKAALDYIRRDLEQSVYIYDADGINSIRQQLPGYNQRNNNFPVLVFWKRQFISQGLRVGAGGTGRDDTFVYSLVAYYIVKDNNATWSNAARIERFQISNGYGETAQEIEDTRDRGFQDFTKLFAQQGDLKTKMNKWTKAPEAYTQRPLVLLDYIDHTPINANQNPAPTCPPSLDPNTPPLQLIPQYTGTGDRVVTGNVVTRGFYVCVDSLNTVAEVNIRGNAIARIQNNNIDFNRNNRVYFPEASTRVKGRGFVFTR